MRETVRCRSGRLPRLAAAALTLAAAGCSSAGEATVFDPDAFDVEPGWISVSVVPMVLQKESADCGTISLAMVLAHWGVPVAAGEFAVDAPLVPGKGTTAKDLRDFARKKDLECSLIHGRVEDLRRELSEGHPVIVGLVKQGPSGAVTHYEVVVALHPHRRIVVTYDPANGWRQNSFDGFREEWDPAGSLTIVFVRPGPRPPDPEGRP